MKLSFVRTVAALAFAALPLATISALPVAAQDQKPGAADAKAEDVVVAVVNGQKIMRSEVEFAAANLPQQYRQMPMQLIFPALLDQLIDAKLIASEGRRQNLQGDAEVKRKLAMLEDRLVQDAFLQRELDKRLTATALRARYDKQIAGLPPEDEVSASHILVKTEDEAKAVIADLKKGGDFAKIAKEKSTDTGSGAQGGELGWFKKSDMVGEFADAAFAMKKGETSAAPVKTQFGFHVIKLEDRRPATPPTFEDLEDELRTELSREIITTMIEQMRDKAKIERFNIDGSKVTDDKKPAEKN